MKILLLSAMLTFTLSILYAQNILHKAIVIDKGTKTPMNGATVKLKNSNKITHTNSQGQFSLSMRIGDTILISSVGYESEILIVGLSSPKQVIELTKKSRELSEVNVVSTGYQKIPRERSTGSFQQINNELFNRSVSTNVLNRLENVASGLIFNKGDAANTDAFLIRGRSTITADAQPLIVLDDFPYDGNLDNLNPNTIESISILRDAAAASIWGARAGNGVIVITTKKGGPAKPYIQLITNLTFQGKPDLTNVSQMSSSDRIGWEKILVDGGHYDNAKSGNTLSSRSNAIPEAVELYLLNPTDLQERLQRLGEQNVKDDLSRYFYQRSVNQQHSLSARATQQNLSYMFSAGYDRNVLDLVGSLYNRVSLSSSNQYSFNKNLKAEASVMYTQSNNNRAGNDGINTANSLKGLSPYANLVDEDGNALPYYHQYRRKFLDTVGKGRLLDWLYRPYDEIAFKRNENKVKDFLINTGLQYNFLNGFKTEVKYQYQNQIGLLQDIHKNETFNARNVVNQFAQLTNSGSVKYIVPLGGTLQNNQSEIQAHQLRLQVNYSKTWSEKHNLTAITGYEIRNKVTTASSHFRYGYDENFSTINALTDLVTFYPSLTSENLAQIPAGINKLGKFTDNFLSYYLNASYSLLNKYTISTSLRKDEANLFGVNTNMKGTPLWSIGGAWNLSNEPFFKVDWMGLLKFRGTYGVNGNISRLASANTITTKLSGGTTHNYPTQEILSPPNKNLRWEKVKILNIGVDFGLKDNRINGTIEFYNKSADDLLAQTPSDPTLGFTSVYANVASMKGKGLDINLSSVNIKSNSFSWETNFLYSYSKSEITDYLMPVSNMGSIYLVDLSSISPIIGKPLYSVYSYPWAGLDPESGAPRVFIDGAISTDYNNLYNTIPLEKLKYHGTAQPTHFGAVRNSFSYKGFNLSFNISYKLGYYFRTASVYNSGLVNGWSGHGDFAKRWQALGDENSTHVPSMIYPADPLRDNIYQYSNIHIHRADNIRLEDINISYDIFPKQKKTLSKMRIFAYASELGALWYANKVNIDPYYNNVPFPGKRISLGVNIDF